MNTKEAVPLVPNPSTPESVPAAASSAPSSDQNEGMAHRSSQPCTELTSSELTLSLPQSPLKDQTCSLKSNAALCV